MGVERTRSHNARLNSFHVAAVSLAELLAANIPISPRSETAERSDVFIRGHKSPGGPGGLGGAAARE